MSDISVKLNNFYIKTKLGVMVCTLMQGTINHVMHLRKEEKQRDDEVISATGKFYPDCQHRGVFRRMAKRNSNVAFVCRATVSLKDGNICLTNPSVKLVKKDSKRSHRMPVKTLQRMLADCTIEGYDIFAIKSK